MKRMLVAFLISGGLLAGTGSAIAASQADAPTTRKEAAAEWSEDGLQRIKASGLDLVYVRPGATLAGYTKVQVSPVSVAFQRNWQRSMQTRAGERIRPEDLQEIRDRLAAIVHEEIASELTKGGYQVVDDAGEDVLGINLRVVELYINAPDLPSTGRVRSYTMSFGGMTMIADLSDSATGSSVMRILDHSEGRDYGVLRWTTQVDNTMEARNIANAWARALRRQLDLAKGIGGKD